MKGSGRVQRGLRLGRTNEKFTLLMHNCTYILQDLDAVCVGPVVDDLPHLSSSKLKR
jgi:hypothetical protein